jgi:hypothetical protein
VDEEKPLRLPDITPLPPVIPTGEFYLLELCPRGNNKDVIIIILVHDNVYIPC